MQLHPRHLALLAAPLVLAACIMGGPSTPGVVMAPLSPSPTTSASALPSVVASGPSQAPSASPLPAGVFFRDDFDGNKLDASRWTAFERDGRVVVEDGKLEMLMAGLSRTFPLVVPRADNIPKEGPFYLELRYDFSTAGRISSINIDYVSPFAADDPGVSEPLMNWGPLVGNINYVFRTEKTLVGFPANAGALKLNESHRFRLEYDGSGTYRAIYDDTELTTFQSARRPTRLWFGPYPNKPVDPLAWASWRIDYIESGVLVSPDPAKPRSSQSPSTMPPAAASPAASDAATPSPSASPAA